jgi:hypothetical protein
VLLLIFVSGCCNNYKQTCEGLCSLVFIRALVTPTVLGLTPRIPGFNGIVFSVVADVPVDSEALVTSLISSRGFVGLVFEDAYRGRVCVRAFIRMSERALRLRCTL